MNHHHLLLGALFLSPFIGNCGVKVDPVPSCTSFSFDVLSYAQDVDPILANHCRACHSRTAANRFGAKADIEFDVFEDAVAHADRLVARALSGTMPPAAQLDQVGVTLLTNEQACLLSAWTEQGANP